jgi:hypothetical protein
VEQLFIKRGIMKSLRSLDTFGGVAAEDDAVLDYFLTTNAVQEIVSNRTLLVLGRKGTGKTAIVRHFTERTEAHLAKSLNLGGYPWSVHASRIDRGASDIEAYVSSWRYLIAVELAALALANNLRSRFTPLLEKFLRDNYGGVDPSLSDVLRPKRLRLSKASLQPSVMGNQLGGVDLDRSSGDHQLGLELNALSTAILDAVAETVGGASNLPLSLHFDELDQGITKVDERRNKMLIGLVLAARQVRRDCDKLGVVINPVIYLRTDLWDEFRFSDKNKISQASALQLVWTNEKLLELIETRLGAKLGEGTKWDQIASPELMRGSQSKWNHILARTFLRPRDVIRFLNTALAECKRRSSEPTVFINEDIVDSRDEYSSYLKSELDDEITPHWPEWDDGLRACSAISTITFDRENFIAEYEHRRSPGNALTAEEALQTLYRFSVIGYDRRSGYGGSSWAFQYTDPEAGWDSGAARFKVHLGLKEYAKLREERR